MSSRPSPGSSAPEPGGLAVVGASGVAAAAGLRPGDRIVALDGVPPEDVLDLELAAADSRFVLTVLRDAGRREIEIRMQAGEHHGIDLDGGLGVPLRRCVNRCRFCFVDQLPPGLRRSLSVKDDDYRLSFLHGTFITLSNLDEHDLQRIEALRLSPLYVSLHDWDDVRRAALMGERALVSRARLERLAAAGIVLHVQVVLCPGVNDEEALRETLLALGALDGVADVGVVPVSVSPGHELRRVGAPDAAAALTLIEGLQDGFRRRRGVAFAHAADELYLLAGRQPPTSDAECQYENGVGVAATFLADVEELAGAVSRRPPVALLSGVLAAPLVHDAARRLGEARPLVVANRLFGPHVSVTGLLGGREVLERLAVEPLRPDEWLLAPAAFLPPETGLTLDDVPLEALQEACSGRLVVADGLREAFGRLRR